MPPGAEAPPLPSYAGWLSGASGHEDALRRQQESGSPVLVYFYTDWCPFCRQFDDSVANSADPRLLRVRVNPEAGDAERALQKQYGVTGYPSLFVIANAGGSPRRVAAGVGGRDDRPDPAAFTQSCRDQLVSALFDAGRSARGGETHHLDRGIQLAPDEPALWHQRGAIRWNNGDRERGRRDLERACSLGARDACAVIRG